MVFAVDIAIDIHSINLAGVSIPMGYCLLLLFIVGLFIIIWVLLKMLLFPFLKKKWESIEKVGELLPSVSTLINQYDRIEKSYETLNHSVRTDLVHEMKDMKNSITGIMAMVKETQEDNRELALAHSKLRGEHDAHVISTKDSITEIRKSVHEILQKMPPQK